VLINLLGNAVKFTEKGEIVLQIRPAIRNSTQVELHCTVTDSGIGISESDQHRLFQPFTQVDGGTTRRHGGTGLGLSIAQRLVKLMGGNMGVKSSVGVGTTFWFTVTLRVLAVPDAPTVPAATMSLSQPASQGTILLVEDQEPNQVLALEQLGKLGYTVELAQNGQEACTRVQEAGTDYALILMDCQMPMMDGFQATEQIRAYEKHVGGHTPIIAMTAQAMKQDEERCLAVGMDGYLRKPVRLQELKNALEQWLG
jgi:CheY-like chemotaxis protein